MMTVCEAGCQMWEAYNVNIWLILPKEVNVILLFDFGTLPAV